MTLPIIYVFELATYGFAALMIHHAWCKTRAITARDTRAAIDESDLPSEIIECDTGEAIKKSDLPNRARWLATLLWGIVFGLVIEWLLVTYNDYRYGEHLISFPNLLEPSRPVPLWIGVGWGLVLYSTTWTAQRLKLPAFPRAVFAGLLALTIDFALDPIAARYDLWYWPEFDEYGAAYGYAEGEGFTYARFFGVPYDNFICWFLIVSTYTGFVRAAFRLFDKHEIKAKWKISDPWAAALLPPVGAAISIGVVFWIDTKLPGLYTVLRADQPVFLVLLFIACVIVACFLTRPERDLEISWPVVAVPIAYNALSYLVLVAHDAHMNAFSPLLLGIPLNLIIAVFAFNLVSVSKLVPRRSPARLSNPGEAGPSPSSVLA